MPLNRHEYYEKILGVEMSNNDENTDAKTEHILRQLGRTKNKKFEMLIISRILHRLNNFDIKFVTQQYVSRPNGKHALTDLYFPQLNTHIEVDEGFHKETQNVDRDRIRQEDIVRAVENTKFERIDATGTIEKINQRVDELVEVLRERIEDLKFPPSDSTSKYVAWDIDAESNPETYKKLGHIDLKDNVAFRTIYEACNCFGHNFKGYQRGGAGHEDDDTILWFPKLYPNGEWENSITFDEEQITEKNIDPEKAVIHVDSHINGVVTKRIVFARVKNNLGEVMYRFRGTYELNKLESLKVKALVWDRIATRVDTYYPKIPIEN